MRSLAGLVLVAVVSGSSQAAVFCAKPSRDGTLNGSVKVRELCKRTEVQLAPGEVGFCCPTPTTVTTTSSCPTFTTTTLGIPDCGGSGGACAGLCANARACIADPDGICGCTGAELPCGVVSAAGACGGTCPSDFTCTLFSPVQANGCPAEPRCGCVPEPCGRWGAVGCNTGLPGSGGGECCTGFSCGRVSGDSDIGVCGGGTCIQSSECPRGECVDGACCAVSFGLCVLGCCPGYACGGPLLPPLGAPTCCGLPGTACSTGLQCCSQSCNTVTTTCD